MDPCRVSIDEREEDLKNQELLRQQQERRRELRVKHWQDLTVVGEALEEVYCNTGLQEKILENSRHGFYSEIGMIVDQLIEACVKRRIESDLNLGE